MLPTTGNHPNGVERDHGAAGDCRPARCTLRTVSVVAIVDTVFGHSSTLDQIEFQLYHERFRDDPPWTLTYLVESLQSIRAFAEIWRNDCYLGIPDLLDERNR